ncbi:putative spermidine/putrescine transport system substrate-binding protein [Rhodoligotrophos appendicifer]|uniref:ABC transporter substrate-binding protein n=1 Tax=Rhodoligotrophos appendicifer TaxID=987056 RepID=UPI001184C97B|nr:ABC transporter substrate-binding protein [Rhodoligotrophos appendicifer]
MKKRLRIRAYIALAALATTSLFQGLAPTPAMAAGSIVLACYPGAPETFIRQELIPLFEKETGATVTYLTGNSVATIAKLQAQKDDPQIDVACIDDGPMIQAAGMGLLQTLTPAEMPNAADIQEVSHLPNGMGLGWGLFRLGLAYNPDEFKKNNLPELTSWNDLARADLKDHVIVSSISISYTHMLLILLARANGGSEENIEPGFAEMVKIKPNIFNFDTTADLTSYFQQGEAWVGVWTDSETYSYAHRTGFPIKFVFPKEGTAAIQAGIAVVKNGKNTELATKFVNFLVGQQAQEIMAQKLGWLPVNKKATLPPDMSSVITSPPANGDKIVPIDWTYLNKQLPAWTERWNKEIEVQ